MKYQLSLLIFLISFEAISIESRVLSRNPRGLLMGDAFTALADDQYSLFYNPALLARHEGFSFYPINISLTGMNILSTKVDADSLGDSEPEDMASELMGIPIHLGFNYNPGFKMGRFGLSAINNMSTNLILQNEVSPTLEVDHRVDKGFIAGYAHPIFGSYRSGVGTQLSLGMSVKYIEREGIYDAYYLYGTTVLDTMGAGELNDMLASLGQVKGRGWGVDLGLDYINATPSGSFSMGLAVLDLGTNLQTDKNEQDAEVQPQTTQINFGTAWMAKLASGLDFTLSADIKNLEDLDVEFLRRIHLGGELGITPALSALVGLNAVDNYSYGLKLNAGLIKIYAGFFGVETGEKLGQQDSERFTIYLSLFQFGFNP